MKRLPIVLLLAGFILDLSACEKMFPPKVETGSYGIEWTIHLESNPRYRYEWWMIKQIFRYYERGEKHLIPGFFIKKAKEDETHLFIQTLDNLVWPDRILSHSFRFLNKTTVYGYGESGLDDVMADVAVCDTVTVESRDGSIYRREFYLFYHVHFIEENGTKFEFFGSPLIRPNCAHQ